MINEEKIKVMAQLAVYEKTRNRREASTINKTKKEYVNSNTMKVLISIVILILLAYGGIIIFQFHSIKEKVSFNVVIFIIIISFLIISVFLALYIRNVYYIYDRIYTENSRRLAYYSYLLKQIEKMYSSSDDVGAKRK